jgi:L-cysteine:1D-myo-inositol 2-amino-2-deoxy-alpha-D-glucopyranoside ligase
MESWRAVAVPKLPGTGPRVRVADTASRGVLREAARGPVASLYACGITPYDATHIGHAATYLAWDLLVRAWRDAGYEVRYVQNVTDVDDPLLDRAAATGEDWRELADREIALFRSDMQALRMLPPDHYVGAVEALGVIEGFNRTLSDRGALYELDGDFYFAKAADPAFGTVSGLGTGTMTELFAERGGDPGRPGKKDPLDPLVWQAQRPGEPGWESVFGRGRPGWHVECAAIATAYLGETFDVQAGGNDLVFPHHEMSASHARVAAASEQAFARCYAHAGMVRFGGEKMSKSLGNLVFVSRLLAGGAEPMAIRLAILAHRYGTDWDWSDAVLAAGAERLARWRSAFAVAEAGAGGGAAGTGAAAGAGAAGAAAGAGAADAGARADADASVSAAADAGPAAASIPAAASVLAAVRERLADNLDAPGALAAVDRWAGAVLAAPGRSTAGPHDARLVRDTVDALLGIAV